MANERPTRTTADESARRLSIMFISASRTSALDAAYECLTRSWQVQARLPV